MWLQDYEAAAEALEQHALAVPSSTRTRYNLALCYARMGQPAWAHAEMVKALVIDDQADAAYIWLASEAEQAGDFGAAVGWLDALLTVWTAPAGDFDGLSRQRRRLAVAMAAAGQSLVTPELPGVGSDLTPEGVAAR
jgi:Tfp pilus assembly protein PilF